MIFGAEHTLLFFNFFDIEQWSFVATVATAFVSLALIPILSLVRKYRTDRRNELQIIKDSVTDLCHRIAHIEEWIKIHDSMTDTIQRKVDRVITDVRVLEALGERTLDEDRGKGRKRKEDDTNQYG